MEPRVRASGEQFSTRLKSSWKESVAISHPRLLLIRHLLAGNHRTQTPSHSHQHYTINLRGVQGCNLHLLPSVNQQATVTINPEIWGNGFPCTKDTKDTPEAYTLIIR
ncbi:unnamed protein product [Parnassius apollo]|uniref:(apollo) hypothetical protein n=1 Tax=Parnassius apollo TaxID=110799 RepID=A0A8S3X763_PARAO|nr:unnamed protein product [Parnassius apollo]